MGEQHGRVLPGGCGEHTVERDGSQLPYYRVSLELEQLASQKAAVPPTK